MAAVTTGACLCGGCTYSYTDEPVVKALCHCGPCLKISGSTNTTNFVVPEASFKLTKGTPKSFAAPHEFGMTLTIYFCPDCGNTLWKEASAPAFDGLKIVQAGTLSDVSKLNTKIDAEFYAPLRTTWLAPVEGAAQKNEF